MAKKQYSKPQAEKVDFDYVESVVACPSGCVEPSHTWHAGQAYPICNGGGNNNNNNNNNNNGVDPYYAPGWSLGC